jgi:hypothetical protein
VDDPNDDCDPSAGGRDCGGICVQPGGDQQPLCGNPDRPRNYISRDPDKCPALLFQCPQGTTAFFDGCGCGCQATEGSCTYREPNRRYVSEDTAQCAALRFLCNKGEEAFFNDCGCGCEALSP